MRGACCILGLVVLTGCATALKRDAECLARLTPDYLAAQDSPASRLALEWYPRVYERLASRLEEEQILSEVRWVLAAHPPSLIFYPIIRWNIHSVMWDGLDPEAGSDPLNQFCTARLAEETAPAEPGALQPR